MTAAGVQRNTLRVLTASQVLGGVGVASGIAVGGLLAAELHGSAALAGVAQTCSTVGAAALAVPMSRLMGSHGRRSGLAAGYTLALCGALSAVLAARAGALWLLLVGMVLFGAGTTSNMQARYAATDLAEPDRRSRALSIVVWATTVGAVVGPNLAEPGADLAVVLGLPPLAGAFLFSVVSFVLAGSVLLVLLRPDPLLTARARERGGSATGHLGVAAVRTPFAAALRMVWRSGSGRLGLVTVAVAHTAMVAVMVMTPVHMGEHGASLRVVGFVISGHILGMFAFSPLVGLLADLLGRRIMVLLGALLLMGAVAIAGTAPEHGSGQLGVGLFLLGLGWSCGLVAGSTLVTEDVPAEARPSVQGVTDMVMGCCAGAGGLLAGPIVAGLGYGALNLFTSLVVAPLLALALVSVHGSRESAAGVAPAEADEPVAPAPSFGRVEPVGPAESVSTAEPVNTAEAAGATGTAEPGQPLRK